MNAHQLDGMGVIINTIVVNALTDFPNLVDASIGGSIGDSIINGAVVRKVPSPLAEKQTVNAAILAQLADIDAKSIRALRTNDAQRLATLEQQAAALRAGLLK